MTLYSLHVLSLQAFKPRVDPRFSTQKKGDPEKDKACSLLSDFLRAFDIVRGVAGRLAMKVGTRPPRLSLRKALSPLSCITWLASSLGYWIGVKVQAVSLTFSS